MIVNEDGSATIALTPEIANQLARSALGAIGAHAQLDEAFARDGGLGRPPGEFSVLGIEIEGDRVVSLTIPHETAERLADVDRQGLIEHLIFTALKRYYDRAGLPPGPARAPLATFKVA